MESLHIKYSETIIVVKIKVAVRPSKVSKLFILINESYLFTLCVFWIFSGSALSQFYVPVDLVPVLLQVKK